jgi:cytochrome c6
MKNIMMIVAALAVVCIAGWTAAKEIKVDPARGEELFNNYCANCHPKGGNVIKPEKTLTEENLKKYGVINETDIVKLMRNPGPGMIKFDEKTIPDKDATEIASYILQTFK